jgi:hypothetical protein
VKATSAADNTKFASCVINVAVLSITVSADSGQIDVNTSTIVRATISPAFADNRATWSLVSGNGSISTNGPSTTTTYSAPGTNGTRTVRGTSVADSSKFQDVNISVVGQPPPPPPPPPPPGKFITDEIQQNLVPEDEKLGTAAKAQASKTDGKARTFLKPQKRPK